MKWEEVRSMLRQKLGAKKSHGAKHDAWPIECDGVLLGRVLDSRGKSEVTGRERGNIAESLGVSERELRALVSCTMSRDQYVAKVQPTK